MYGRGYSIFGQRAMSASAPQTALGVTAAGANLKGAGIYDITFGSVGTPADSAFQFEAQRYTAAGTGATTTAPTPLDSTSDTASDTTSVQANSADPTFTANTILGYWPLNQRATHRWSVDPTRAMVVARVASNGIGIWGTHASSTVNWSVFIHFWE